MIPILFETGTTTFTSNGLGRLADCIRCIATEERNGIYEVEFDYPTTGKLFQELKVGRIVVCTHDEKGDEQPFIIYRRSIPDLRGIVTFNAHHISYMLNDIVVKPFTASSCSVALQNIKTYSVNSNPFNFWTDKGTTATYKSTVPRLARNMLGGEENSILDVYGSGEYLFDKFDVRLYANRGRDSGVEIRYGKNLADLSHEIDNTGTYNAIVPYWADTEGNVLMLSEVIISYAKPGERVDAAPMDLSDAFDEMPTAAQLRSAARSRYESGDSWIPVENIRVDFIQLWQTEEYKRYAALQRAGLCDTVSVFYPRAGIEKIKQKVIRVVYNVLLERYDEMELGTLSASLGQSIKQNILEEVPTNSMMESAIQYATKMIQGGLGGYVVMTPGEKGYPQEILIMDTPDVNTARNVWRFNKGGLGHSSTGYQGPYSDIALTADGKINASMITTGILNAGLIRAGVLKDVNGNVSWNLETGVLTMTKGSINLGSGNFIVTDAGLVTIKKGSINLGNGNFIVNDSGEVTIKNGSINLGSGNFVVTSAGLITVKKGSINLGNGNFTVNDSGYLTAISGKIADLSFNDSQIYYQDSEQMLKLNKNGLETAKTEYDGSRIGIKISEHNIAFQWRANSTNWNMSERANIQAVGTSTDDTFYLRFLVKGQPYLSLIPKETELSVWDSVYINRHLVSWQRSDFEDSVNVRQNLTVSGTKSRSVDTQNYSDRLLYCYETPTPLFGDIGEAQLDEEGFCFVDIDDIFSETIAEKVEYQVFLQKEGQGDCWVAEKGPRYFVIQGTPNLKVAWELKAKQKDYETFRLEHTERNLDEYISTWDDGETDEEAYIREQEEILYG